MYNHFVRAATSEKKCLRGRLLSSKLQRGSSLVELLVGITLGLMVVTAAIGTLVFSRTVSQAVSDQLELQQQANMAIRIMSTTLREGNTRELAADNSGNILFTPLPGFNASQLPLQGLARDAQGNDNIGISYADVGGAPAAATRDCLGNTNATTTPGPPPSVPAGGVVNNRFYVDTNRLMCAGTAAATGPQPLISDVQRFRVLYGVQTGIGAATITNYFTQANVPDWNTANVVAVELCLELATRPRGLERPPGNYTNCDGISVSNDRRIRAIVRQTVRLRSVPVI